MDLIKNLSQKQLKDIKRTLSSLEFYGLKEEDIRDLPALLNKNLELINEINELKEEVNNLKKIITNLTNPDIVSKKQLSNIAKDCFTLPEVD